MFSQYVELKDIPSLQGSINVIVSNQNYVRRPPSLSESYAWEPKNIERALASNYESSASLNILERGDESSPQNPKSPQSPQSPQSPNNPQNTIFVHESNSFKIVLLDNIFRFLFHLTLISIFETVFFFFYVSTLEDNGIINTTNSIIEKVINSCSKFSNTEKEIANDILSLFVNESVIISNGISSEIERIIYNKKLYNRAWIYMGTLSGTLGFFLIIIYVCNQTHFIKWRVLILENIGLVFMLALYEYMFFSTIIIPYLPITGAEIEKNTIQELQSTCGLL